MVAFVAVTVRTEDAPAAIDAGLATTLTVVLGCDATVKLIVV
jgi:hypothetical protein